MTSFLASVFVHLFVWAWNRCALLDDDLARNTLQAMAAQLRVDETQRRYREAVG